MPTACLTEVETESASSFRADRRLSGQNGLIDNVKPARLRQFGSAVSRYAGAFIETDRGLLIHV